MNRDFTKRFIIILLVFSLAAVFAACSDNNDTKQETDPMIKFKNQVLDLDPDITDSTLTTAGDNTILMTIVVRDIATDDFANEIGKNHAKQLKKKFPEKVVKLKVVKGGNTIGDFTIGS
ncbi:MAG: hypothetical protein ACOZCL_15455 [Bacillota bacterium]